MLRLLIVAAVVAAVFCQDKPCCPPEKWEGIQAGQGGFYAAGKPQILVVTSFVAVDRQKQLVFSFTNSSAGPTNSSQMIYQDYQQNVQYVYNVLDKTCAKTPIAQKFYDGCLPPQSKYMGSYTIGAGSESVKAKSYTLHMDEAGSILDAAITVTENLCVPVGENIVGSANKVPLAITYGFVNITPGISDPNIFNPPAVCKQNPTPYEPEVHHHLRVF